MTDQRAHEIRLGGMKMVTDLAMWFRRKVEEPDSGANEYDLSFLLLAEAMSYDETIFAAVALMMHFIVPYLENNLASERLSEQQIEYLKNVQLAGKPS